MSRDELMLKSRPDLGLITKERKRIEEFQDFVLRPILKFQNDCLLSYFRCHLIMLPKPLSSYTFTAQKQLVKEVFTKDIQLKRNLAMFVVALFTQSEMQFYWKNKVEIHKRIYDLTLKRLQDQVELLS